SVQLAGSPPSVGTPASDIPPSSPSGAPSRPPSSSYPDRPHAVKATTTTRPIAAPRLMWPSSRIVQRSAYLDSGREAIEQGDVCLRGRVATDARRGAQRTRSGPPAADLAETARRVELFSAALVLHRATQMSREQPPCDRPDEPAPVDEAQPP